MFRIKDKNGYKLDIKFSINYIIFNSHSLEKLQKHNIKVEYINNIKNKNIYIIRQKNSKGRNVGNDCKALLQIKNKNNKIYYIIGNIYISRETKYIYMKVFTVLSKEQLITSYNLDFASYLNIMFVNVKFGGNKEKGIVITPKDYSFIKEKEGNKIKIKINNNNNIFFDTEDKKKSAYIDYIWYIINIGIKKYKYKIKLLHRYKKIPEKEFIDYKKDKKNYYLITIPEEIREDYTIDGYGLIKNTNKKIFNGKNILIYIGCFNGKNNKKTNKIKKVNIIKKRKNNQ